MEHQPKTHSLRDYLAVLFKHKTKILTIFFATVLIITAGSFLLPPTFEASSTLLVMSGGEYSRGSEPDNTEPQASFNRVESINSEMEILRSRDLIEKVISTMGVENIYPDLSKKNGKNITLLKSATEKFKKKLSLKRIERSNMIQVSFRHEDPEISARAVNLLVDYSRDKHFEIFRDPRASFIEKQLAVYREKLEESERNFEAFKQKHGVFSMDEQRRFLLSQRADFDTSFKKAENRKAELSHTLSSLEKQMKEGSKSQTLSRELEMQMVNTKTELASLGARIASITKQIVILDSDIRNLELREIPYRKLERELAANEMNYQDYLRNTKEARTTVDLNLERMVSVRVIQTATVPPKPNKSRKGLHILIGMILGSVSGLGLAFSSEYLGQGLLTPEKAESRLRLPVLATLSHRKSKEKTARTRKKMGKRSLGIKPRRKNQR